MHTNWVLEFSSLQLAMWVIIMQVDKACSVDDGCWPFYFHLVHECCTSRQRRWIKAVVECIYQKTQLEHILLCPYTYIRSMEVVVQPVWVYDEVQDAIAERQIKPCVHHPWHSLLSCSPTNKETQGWMQWRFSLIRALFPILFASTQSFFCLL